MLIRIVRMTFQADKVEAFLTNFQEHKSLIRSFEGCKYLELLQDAEKANIFCTYSHWESEEALNQYRDSALFKEIWSYTKTLFAEKPIAFSVFRREIV